MALTHYRSRALKSVWLRAYGEDYENGDAMSVGIDTFLVRPEARYAVADFEETDDGAKSHEVSPAPLEPESEQPVKQPKGPQLLAKQKLLENQKLKLQKKLPQVPQPRPPIALDQPLAKQGPAARPPAKFVPPQPARPKPRMDTVNGVE